MRNATGHRHGFTLIELSIVLVIIGLIVGGVLVGQDMIKAAGIRKTGTELTRFSTALATFRTKYNCVPGDCSNATDFFGTDSNGCPNGGGSTGTCNGNGDGIINGLCCSVVENLAVWKQLAMAQFISGTYPGNAGPIYYIKNPGVNVPSSAYNPAIGYNIFTAQAGLCSAPPFAGAMIQMGEVPTSGGCGNDFLWGSGLNAPDSMFLDAKFDDGLPNTGVIRAAGGQPGSGNPSTTCLSGNSYSTSLTTGCVLYYDLRIE